MAIFYPPPEPRQAYRRVLPVTPGAQPRPAGPLGGSAAVLSVIGVWSTLAAVPMPTQKPLNVVPLTLVYGQQPPRTDPLPRVQAQTIRMSWPEAGEPRLQLNDQQPEHRYVVAQTLKYGSQPSPVGPLTPTEVNKLVRWWDQPFLFPQRLPSAAAFYVPPAVNNPPPTAPLAALDLIRRQYKEWTIIALTSPGVIRTALADQPPIASAITTTEMALLRLAWEPPFRYPESEPNSASWNVPAIVQTYLAPKVSPWWINAAWRAPFEDIQFSGTFIPDVPDAPPVCGSITPQEMAIARLAWEPARSEPPRLVRIAPITLSYGQQPPIAGALPVSELQILRTMVPWWPSQSASDNAAWNVATPSPIVALTRVRPQLSAQGWWVYVQPEQGRRWIASLLFVRGDTTTIYGPFLVLADRLVVGDPGSRVVIYDPSHTVTFVDPASRLIIVTEEP